MVILTSQLNSHIKTFETQNFSEKQLKEASFRHSKQPTLLQAIMEGLVDGVLVLTKQGELVYANECGRQICDQLSQGTSAFNSLPQAIWGVCESFLDSHNLLPELETIVNNDINPNCSATFRVRVRWLVLEDSAYPYLLVIMEDQNLSKQMQAIADAKRYGLTPREAEVWSLHQAKISYKEIAERLYITVNTVKKHIKNIYSKQQNSWEL